MIYKKKLFELAEKLKWICWSIAVFFYYFQVPFQNQAWLITTGVAAFLLLNIKKLMILLNERFSAVFTYLLLLIFCLISGGYSNYVGNDLSNVVRFFLILSLIPIIPILAKSDDYNLYKSFCVFSLLKAIMIISIAYIVVSTGTINEMRLWAQLNGYGDIYSLYNNIPRVQLKGNALLVVAFMISFVKNRKITLYNFIILLAVLLAGNFAFILGLIVFVLWQYCGWVTLKRMSVRQVIVTILLFLTMVGFGQYTILEAGSKDAGDSGSNATRLAQVEILSDTNPFVGSGLGSIVRNATKMGRGMDGQYYEIQTMYIFFQVGILGLLLFYISMFYVIKKYYSFEGIMLVSIYLFFSFFNPYCFDSTQMIAMALFTLIFPSKN